MEKLVRVISQGAPQSRQWTNPNTGEMKTITSVEVEMTDGLDRFIAEATAVLPSQVKAAVVLPSQVKAAAVLPSLIEAATVLPS